LSEVEKDMRIATNQTLDNIEAILKAAGSGWEYIVRTEVFLNDFDKDWDIMNEEYTKRFPKETFPARYSLVLQIKTFYG
jgi:2-iminobutanoate/2-iminopropanoate deaminase